MNSKAQFFRILSTMSAIFAVINFLSLMEVKDLTILWMYIFNVTMYFIFKGIAEHAEKIDKSNKKDN